MRRRKFVKQITFATAVTAACYPWADKGICGACAIICPLGEKEIGFDFANFYRPVVKDGCMGCGLYI